MRVSLLTLAFSPALGRFVDEPLRDLLARTPATAVREHFFVVDNLPYLLCVVTHAPAAARPHTPAAARPHEELRDEASDGAPASAEPAVPARTLRQGGPALPVQELLHDLDAEQRLLFEKIRRWRSKKARDEGAPPYVVLTNRQLVEIVRQRPRGKVSLGQIDGLGDKKIARHGTEILALLWPDVPKAEERDDAQGTAAASPEAASTAAARPEAAASTAAARPEAARPEAARPEAARPEAARPEAASPAAASTAAARPEAAAVLA